MPDKRIELPAESLILYAKLLLYCIKSKIHEPISVIIEELATEIRFNLESDRDKFLSKLAKEINKYQVLKGLYGKIHNDIRVLNKSFISFNSSSGKLNLYQYIKDTYPNDSPEKFMYFISDVVNVQFIKKETPVASPNNQTSAVEKEHSLLAKFNNTTWYVYLQTYDASPPTKYAIISRPILRIINSDEVYLYSSKEEHDFVGKIAPVSFSYNSIIVIDLEKQYSKYTVKKLQLRVAIEDILPKETILLGQYSYFESSNEMICGTIVMQKYIVGQSRNNELAHSILKVRTDYDHYRYREIILEGGEKFIYIRVALSYWSGWECFIPRLIAEYLVRADKNFISTLQLGSPQMSGLKTLLKERPEHEEKYNAIIEYDGFMITPIGGLKEIKERKYFKDINQVFFNTPNPSSREVEIQPQAVYEATKSLKQININWIYYSPRVKAILEPDASSDGDSQAIAENELEAMKRSRFVIFIMPEQNQIKWLHTSVWIKIGWAMRMHKTILVFPLAANLLPTLLTTSRLSEVHTFSPVKIEEIPEKLKSDCTYLHSIY